MWRRRKRPEPWKGLAAGLAGGLVASWTMNQFQAAWSKAASKLKHENRQEQTQSQSESEGPLEQVAGTVSHAILRQDLDHDQKKKYGPVVHYAFGTIMGGLYGSVSELLPQARAGFGTAYGTALFAGADELALPAFKLSKPPSQYPLSTHAYALASHCVYGVTTEAVRRLLRKVW